MHSLTSRLQPHLLIDAPTEPWTATGTSIVAAHDGLQLSPDDRRVQYLDDALALLQLPGCQCALSTGSGRPQAPWDTEDIYVEFNSIVAWFDVDAISDPVDDIIWVDSSITNASAPAKDLAHEAGHFYSPYLGHGGEQSAPYSGGVPPPNRFNGENVCGSQNPFTDTEYAGQVCNNACQ